MNLKDFRTHSFNISVIFACLFFLEGTHRKAIASPNLVVDGSFEGAGSGGSFSNGMYLEQGSNWAVYASPNMAAGIFNNKTLNTNQFFRTSYGTNFLLISHDPHSAYHYPNSAVAQEITTALTNGLTYKISFKQCCFKDLATNGSVNVEVVPTDGGGLIYNKTFTINNPAEGWVTKSDTFPVTTNGNYTLVFIADDQAKVAIIDDVSLSVK